LVGRIELDMASSGTSEPTESAQVDGFVIQAVTGAVLPEGDRGKFPHCSPPSVTQSLGLLVGVLLVVLGLPPFLRDLPECLFEKRRGLFTVGTRKADGIDLDSTVERDIDMDLL
jgi:hypothetical protein